MRNTWLTLVATVIALLTPAAMAAESIEWRHWELAAFN